MIPVSGLQKFIGSREGGAEATDQGISYVGEKKERLQAKMQEMGFIDLEEADILSNSASKPTDAVNLRRKIIADQHRLKVPTNFSSRNSSNVRSPGMRQGHNSSSVPPQAVQSMPRKDQEDSYNPFDTDADSLEATATFSNFTDSREHETSFQDIGHFGNDSHHVYGDKQDTHHISVPAVTQRQRHLSQISDRHDPNIGSEDEEVSGYDGSGNVSSDEERPENDGKDDDRVIEKTVTQEATHQREQATYFHSRPMEYPRPEEEHTEPPLNLPTISPELCQESAGGYINKPSCRMVISVASEAVGGNAFDSELDQQIQSRQIRLPETSSKQDRAGPNGNSRYDAIGNTGLLRTGMSKKTSPYNSPHSEVEICEQHHSADPAQLPREGGRISYSQATSIIFPQSAKPNQAPATELFEERHGPNKLPFVGDRRNPDARNSQNEMPSNTQKCAQDLDYTSSQLSGMPFDLLSSESFDNDPRAREGDFPEGLTTAPLSQRLQYAHDLKHDEEQHLQRRAIFSSMTINQYEECGDLLIERFGEITTRYRQARQQKRKVAKEFEDEVARREERVRRKREGVDGDLRRLRRAGEDVVRGKES